MRTMPVINGQIHLYRHNYNHGGNIFSSSGGSSPTKGMPSKGAADKYAYQVTYNQSYKDDEEDDVTPPSLPPRNYRSNSATENRASSQSQQQPQSPLKPAAPQALQQTRFNYTNEFENSPQADMYAEQLRKQAQRYSKQGSQSQLMAVAPRTVSYQSKPVPGTKTSISNSRPVDKPPSPQEAMAPPMVMYRSTETPQDLNLSPLNSSQGSDAPSLKSPTSVQQPISPSSRSSEPISISVIHQQTKSDSSDTWNSSSNSSSSKLTSSHTKTNFTSPQPTRINVVHLSSATKLLSGSQMSSNPTAVVSPRDGKDRRVPSPVESRRSTPRIIGGDMPPDTPPPPPPSDQHTPDSHNMSQPTPGGDQEFSNGALSPEYSNDSYMYNRGSSARQGFAGNYIRSASSEASPQNLDADFQTPTSLAAANGSSQSQLTSVNPPRTETLYKVTSVVTVPSSTRRTDNNINMETGPKVVPRSQEMPPWRSRPRADTVPMDTSPGHEGHSRFPAEDQYFSNSRMNKSIEIPISHTTTPSRSAGEGKEDVESPSVRSVISNFERKRPPPRVAEKPNISRNRIKDMKDDWVTRSNENLVDYNSRGSSAENLSENNAPVEHIIPVRVAQVSSQSNQFTPSPRASNGNGRSPLGGRKFANGVDAFTARKSASEQSYVDTPPSSRNIAIDVSPDNQVPRNITSDLGGSGSQRRSFGTDPSQNNSHVIRPQHLSESGSRTSSEIPIEIVSRKKHSTSEIPSITSRRESEDVFHPPTSSPVTPQSPYNNSVTPHGATNTTNVSSITAVVAPLARSPEVDDPRHGGDSDNSISSPGLPSSSEPRRVSQEELDCDTQAAIVAKQLQKSDRKLSTVIMPPPQHKTSVDFMTGLFETSVDPNYEPTLLPQAKGRRSHRSRQDSPSGSSSFTSPGFSPQNRSFNDDSISDTITRQKEELSTRIDRKMAFMREEQNRIQEEIDINNELGKQITTVVERKLTHPTELEKYRMYVGELDTVMCLLLKVSGRLARAENALLGLTEDASEKQRATLTAKRDEVSQKHEDARLLKEGIDRRRQQVAVFLSNTLTEDEFCDYQHFVNTKSKLALELQEVKDKLAMSQEQLSALRGSLYPRSGFSSLTGSPASIGRADTSLNSSTQST